MEIKDDTRKAPNYYFAVNDIEDRIERALEESPEVFYDPKHLQLVGRVEDAGRAMLQDFAWVKSTPRYKTRSRPAHTEVKFNKCVGHNDHVKRKKIWIKTLKGLGIKEEDMAFRVTTASYAVRDYKQD